MVTSNGHLSVHSFLELLARFWYITRLLEDHFLLDFDYFFHSHGFILTSLYLPFPSLSRDLNPLLSFKCVILSLDLFFLHFGFSHPQKWHQVSTKYLLFSNLKYTCHPHLSTYNFHLPTTLSFIRAKTIFSLFTPLNNYLTVVDCTSLFSSLSLAVFTSMCLYIPSFRDSILSPNKLI